MGRSVPSPAHRGAAAGAGRSGRSPVAAVRSIGRATSPGRGAGRSCVCLQEGQVGAQTGYLVRAETHALGGIRQHLAQLLEAALAFDAGDAFTFGRGRLLDRGRVRLGTLMAGGGLSSPAALDVVPRAAAAFGLAIAHRAVPLPTSPPASARKYR